MFIKPFVVIFAANIMAYASVVRAQDRIDTYPGLLYRCIKFEGTMRIHVDGKLNVIERSFYITFDGIENMPTGSRLTSAFYRLSSCSKKNMHCLTEEIGGSDGQSYPPEIIADGAHHRIVYAMPNRIKSGDTYEAEGYRFQVYDPTEKSYQAYLGPVKAAVVLATPIKPNGIDKRYIMYVRDEIGVQEFYFEEVSYLNAVVGNVGELGDVGAHRDFSCTLLGSKGLFSGVKVVDKKMPPPEFRGVD